MSGWRSPNHNSNGGERYCCCHFPPQWIHLLVITFSSDLPTTIITDNLAKWWIIKSVWTGEHKSNVAATIFPSPLYLPSQKVFEGPRIARSSLSRAAKPVKGMDQYVLAFSGGNAIRLSPNKLFHAARKHQRETFAFISAVMARPPAEHIYKTVE